MDLKTEIIQASRSLNIDKIGFTTSAPFMYLKDSLIEQKNNGHTSGFEHPVIDERLIPTMSLPGAKTIISIALAYPNKCLETIPRDEKRGRFARASWGIDYHYLVESKLTKLIELICELNPHLNKNQDFVIQVDTGTLVDTAVAQRAGIGFIGKNGLLITEEFGSFVYLGEIITTVEIAPDLPKHSQCGNCTRCLQACPTQALLGDGRMNAKVCLSYQTQTKGTFSPEFRKKIHSTIYGCDICQLSCPYNQKKDFHHHSEMEPTINVEFPKLKPLLTMTNREFKQKFGHLAGSWRGKKPIQRNAIIALGNLGDRTALELLFTTLETDIRPVIRGSSAWSIGKIAVDDLINTIKHLEKIAINETEESVLVEINWAINNLKEKQNK